MQQTWVGRTKEDKAAEEPETDGGWIDELAVGSCEQEIVAPASANEGRETRSASPP